MKLTEGRMLNMVKGNDDTRVRPLVPPPAPNPPKMRITLEDIEFPRVIKSLFKMFS